MKRIFVFLAGLLAVTLQARGQQAPGQTIAVHPGFYNYHPSTTPAPTAAPLDPHWQIRGFGPTPDAFCLSLHDVWIMPDGSYRYCNNSVFVNPFTALTIPAATSSVDGLLSKSDFVNLRALQSAAFQPASAFDAAGSAASAQSAAISTAQANATAGFNAVITALHLGTASQQPTSAFDPAGAAQSAQTTAVAQAGTNTTAAIAALGLKSASQQLASAFDPAGAAAAALAGLTAVARSGSYADLLNKPALFSGSYTDLTNKPTLFSGSYADLLNKPTIPASQVNSDWSATTGVATILNKPVIPAAQVSSDWNASSGVATILNKPTLSTVATSGSYTDLSNKPSIPAAQVSSDWAASSGPAQILNKPVIPAAQVASDWSASTGVSQILNKPALFSGSYTDLTNKPAIPAAQVSSDWSASTGLAQILNKPVLGTAASQNTTAFDSAGAAVAAQSASLQKSANLSDLGNAATARTNLGLSTVAASGSYTDLSNKPAIPAAQVASDWSATTGVSAILNKPALATVATSGSYVDLTNKPTLSTVATSGSYLDLSNKPSIPAAPVNADWSATNGLAQILNKPTLGTAAAQNISAFDAAGAAASAVAGIPPATASVNGLLSKTDWSTFNAKQAALGFTPLNVANNLSELTSAAGSARTNLGLGSAATQNTSAFQAPLGFTPLNPANSLSELTSTASTARTNLGLSTVAASGSYADLSNKPAIPAAQVSSDWNATTGVPAILNKPTLGTAAAQPSSAFDPAGAAASAQNASLQKSANLSDVASPATALQNLTGSLSAWTPTVTASGSMTVSGVSVVRASYLRLGPLVWFTLQVSFTLGGTASNQVMVTPPVNGSASWADPVTANYWTSSAATMSGMPCYVSVGQILFQLPGGPNFGLVNVTLFAGGFYRVQ